MHWRSACMPSAAALCATVMPSLRTCRLDSMMKDAGINHKKAASLKQVRPPSLLSAVTVAPRCHFCSTR